MQVKCIDSSEYSFLTKGEIYEVIEEGKSPIDDRPFYVILINGRFRHLYQSRFVPCEKDSLLKIEW